MGKRIATAVCLLGITAMAYAQESKALKVSKTRYYRHEVNIGIGGMFLNKKPFEDYRYRVSDAFYLRSIGYGFVWGWSDTSSTGGLVGSYHYHFNKWLSVGGLAAFTGDSYSFAGYYKEEQKLLYYKWKDGEQIPVYQTEKKMIDDSNNKIRENSIFLMPSVKLSWLNNSWCSLYTKALMGWHYQRFRFKSDVFPKEETSMYNESHSKLEYTVIPLGLEIGKQKVRWNLDVGIIGKMGYFQTGIAYRFGRFEKK